MLNDFRENSSTPSQTAIKDNTVDIVNTYKYLGTRIEDKLQWEDNTDNVHYRAQQSMEALKGKW